MPFTLRIRFNINELLNLKYIEIVQVNSRTVCVQHPNNPFVFGSFHLYSIQNCAQVTRLVSKKKNAICVGHVKKPAYYDCLDLGVILKNFLLDCQKIIIMLSKPMVVRENKVIALNSIMELETCI